jgi:hypothetical protein
LLLTAEIRSSSNDALIAVAPVVTVAGIDPSRTRLDHEERAIAIVFDFGDPVFPFWWLIDQGGKLRLDEPEPGYAKHEALYAPA